MTSPSGASRGWPVAMVVKVAYNRLNTALVENVQRQNRFK